MSRRLVWPQPTFTKKAASSAQPTPTQTQEAPTDDATEEPDALAEVIVTDPTEEPPKSSPETPPKKQEAQIKPIWKRYVPQAESTEPTDAPEPAQTAGAKEAKHDNHSSNHKKDERPIWAKRVLVAEPAPVTEPAVDAPAPERSEEKPVDRTSIAKKEERPAWAKRVLPPVAPQTQPSEPASAASSSSASSQQLEQLIKTLLQPALEQINQEISKVKRVVAKKLEEIENRLDREEEQRAKITTWIREHVGPNLEKVRDVVKEEFNARQNTFAAQSQPSTSARRTSSSTPIRIESPIKTITAAATTVESHSTIKSPNSKQAPQPSKPRVVEELWTDPEDDMVMSAASSLYQTPASVAGTGGALSPKDSRVRQRRVATNVKLKRLEEETFGSNDIERFDMPPVDASAKVGLSRANYFLNNQQQAINQYRCPELYDKVRNFADKGGQIVFVPYTDSDRKKDSFVFSIKTNDKVYPICPDGLHRSQVLYLVLLGLKRVLGVSDGVALPHGARCGFDPFVLKDDPDDQTRQFFHMGSKTKRAKSNSKAFIEAFGQDKAARFGEEACGTSDLRLSKVDDEGESTSRRDPLSEIQVQQVMKARQRMREYFDLYYYSLKNNTPDDAKGRRIYITFGSAVPVVIDRILEANWRQDIPRAMIVALPFGVEPYEKPNALGFKSLYQFYASLFLPVAE